MPAKTTLLACALLLLGCSDGLSDAPPVLETYGAIAEAEYEDTLLTAQDLDAAIDAFLASPSDETLEAAREAWRRSRDPYMQTEPYRYYGGPIEQGEPEREGALNSWPIDESVIDYVLDRSSDTIVRNGIVNDAAVTIDEATLRERNGRDADTAITTGYHPIEFLLWGQDDPDTTGTAGQRPFTDYVTEGGDADAARRAEYLRLASTLLQDDLADVLAEWRDEPGTYRSEFAAREPREALRDVLYGMLEMTDTELAGERIGVAVTTGDQEDEHSCFSDNTTRETEMDAIGVRNLYLGRYERVDGSVVEGPSLSDLVAARDAELDARMRERLDASVAAAQAIELRFDEAIRSPDGRMRLRATIDALHAQAETLREVATLLGVELQGE